MLPGIEKICSQSLGKGKEGFRGQMKVEKKKERGHTAHEKPKGDPL